MKPSWDLLNQMFDAIVSRRQSTMVNDRGASLPPLADVKQDQGNGSSIPWRGASMLGHSTLLAVWYYNGKNVSTPVLSLTDGESRKALYPRLD